MKKRSIRCKTCLAYKGNPGLQERYYNAWFDRREGEETVQDIGKELGISVMASYNHAHNHIVPRNEHVKSITDPSAVIQALDGVEGDSPTYIQKDDFELAVDNVITYGMAQMKAKNKDISVNQILAAAKLKGEWKLKKRGQDTELLKMMHRSASGFTRQLSAVDAERTD